MFSNWWHLVGICFCLLWWQQDVCNRVSSKGSGFIVIICTVTQVLNTRLCWFKESMSHCVYTKWWHPVWKTKWPPNYPSYDEVPHIQPTNSLFHKRVIKLWSGSQDLFATPYLHFQILIFLIYCLLVLIDFFILYFHTPPP